MGYYYADRENYEEIQASLGTKGNRHPLSYVLEAADDIAYLTADIEDAFKKGCITFTQLIKELNEYGKQEPEDSDYNKMVQMLIRRFEKGVERGEEQPEMYAVQNWIIQVQGKLIYSATESFASHYGQIMEGTYTKELLKGTSGELIAEALGGIAYKYAFLSQPILKVEIAAETILHFLLDKFVAAILYYDTDRKLSGVQNKLVSLISENYKKMYRLCAAGRSDQEKLYLRLLLVTDYICGMTDGYARNLYLELNGEI